LCGESRCKGVGSKNSIIVIVIISFGSETDERHMLKRGISRTIPIMPLAIWTPLFGALDHKAAMLIGHFS